MSNIYPLAPNFSDKFDLGGGFVKKISHIKDAQNGYFKIELIGIEKVVENYIDSVIIMDLRLAWIDKDLFDKLLKNKETIHLSNFSRNDELYKCLGADNYAKDVNVFIQNLKTDNEYNLMDERALNISIELVEPYYSWNYFYFEIDPKIDGFDEDIASGIIHRYKQRFAQGKGYIDLTVNGGECGIRVNNSDFQYYTQTRDCPPREWDANTSRYQITDICGGRRRAGNYSISGGWAFFSVIE